MEAEAEKSGAAAILEKLEAKLLQLEADAAGEADAAMDHIVAEPNMCVAEPYVSKKGATNPRKKEE